MFARRQADTTGPIDIFYFLNQKRILTENELSSKLPSQDYSEYLSSFYQRRIIDTFMTYKDFQWFKDRCLGDFTRDYSFNPGEYYLITDYDENAPVDEIKKIFNTCYIVQKSNRDYFKRDIYVPAINFDKNTISGHLFTSINISGNINEKVMIDLRTAKNIYENLCMLNGLEKTLYSNDVLEYAKVMREQFLYCTLCAKQYDNAVDMFHRCSTNQTFNSRNSAIVALKKDLRGIKYSQESFVKNMEIFPDKILFLVVLIVKVIRYD